MSCQLGASNRFEALKGEMKGQCSSIRVNNQWRLCFKWPDSEAEPFNIEILDYH